MRKAVCVVEPAKIFDVRTGAEFAVPQTVIDTFESFKVRTDFSGKGLVRAPSCTAWETT